MRRRGRRPYGGPLAALLLVAALAAPVAAEAPESDRTTTQGALRRLTSPLPAERRAAVRRLVDLLPGSRTAIIEALPAATWSIQIHLAEVLARDGSPPALHALLGHLARADETQAVRLRLALARDPGTVERLLAAWRRAPDAFTRAAGGGASRADGIAALIDVLRRAEIEALFVGRKSASGSTGYYKGQYDALKGPGLEPGYREAALAVVTGIALDEAVPTRGLYHRSSLYAFLHGHHVDIWELRSMALNAVAELCTEQDVDIVERMERRRLGLEMKVLKRHEAMVEAYYGRDVEWASKEFQDLLFDWDDALGEYVDQLACLYLIAPDRYDERVEAFLEELRYSSGPRRFAAPRKWSYIAGLLIRVGWYERAIDAYVMAMRNGSDALGYYNQACAYASWSRKVGLSQRARDEKLDMAIECLEASVSTGWRDVAWMDEDRDLDPLREHRQARYAAVVAAIRKDLELPPPDKER